MNKIYSSLSIVVMVLLPIISAHAHPGHGNDGYLLTLLHYLIEPEHLYFGILFGMALAGLLVHRSRKKSR